MGWIKLYRQLLEDRVWLQSTNEQKAILITLLLMANHEAHEWEWQGELFRVMPGQFVTSLASIERACGYSVSAQNVRTALAKFEKIGFITNQSTKTGRLITIVKWEVYKSYSDPVPVELTEQSQSTHKELTPNKNDKNDKNDKKNNTYTMMISEVVDYLNQICGTAYRATTTKTQTLIKARIQEGFELIDFKKVIEIKQQQWGKEEKMRKFLRPETLFGTKFEGYLNESYIAGSNCSPIDELGF